MTEGKKVGAGAAGVAAPVAVQKPKGFAVAGLVLGICGLAMSLIPCFLVIGPIVGIVGIVLSALALSRANAGTSGGKGMALAGLICGIASPILWLVIWLAIGRAAKEQGANLGEALKKIKEEAEKSAPAEPAR